MSDIQPIIDEVDVHFHTAEAMVHRIKQRAGMLVVVMRMGLRMYGLTQAGSRGDK
ncbi:MAG TPA: hypothetical protein PLX97_11800 [Gemmatales bacterium]|nr:hypothetical protein [Gemmatales bacterium]